MKPVESPTRPEEGAYKSVDKLTHDPFARYTLQDWAGMNVRPYHGVSEIAKRTSPPEQMYDNSRLRREIGQYLEKLKNQGLTSRYITQNKGTLMAFLRHCVEREIGSTSGVTADVVLSYLDKQKRFSATYQAQQQAIIGKFLRENGNLVMMRMKIHITGTSRTRVDWLTPEESIRIFDTLMSPRQLILIGAGLLQGMRRVETLRMTVGDARDAINNGILRIRGKGNKERCVPIQDEFRRILAQFLLTYEKEDSHERVLSFGRTRSEVQLTAFCKVFGKKFGFHTLRRTFGRNLWLRNVPIETISELYGHSSIDMTRRYIGLNLTDMSKALSCYNIARSCTYLSPLEK
jgi:integrase